MSAVRGRVLAYLSVFEMHLKDVFQYRIWFWVLFFARMLTMIIAFFLWRAVYAERDLIGGLTLHQMVNYALIAQMAARPISDYSMVPIIGAAVQEGHIGTVLLRPMDWQGWNFTDVLADVVYKHVCFSIPQAVIAWLWLGLTLPTDVRVWLAFLVTMLLGRAVVFCFDWAYGTLAFYTTGYFGLHWLREGLILFLSGALLPYPIMPDWLQKVVVWLPFGQVVYTPTALLTGITPVSEAPRLILVQLLWLVGLFALSRAAFRVGLRRMTVQGG